MKKFKAFCLDKVSFKNEEVTNEEVLNRLGTERKLRISRACYQKRESLVLDINASIGTLPSGTPGAYHSKIKLSRRDGPQPYTILKLKLNSVHIST